MFYPRLIKNQGEILLDISSNSTFANENVFDQNSFKNCVKDYQKEAVFFQISVPLVLISPPKLCTLL